MKILILIFCFTLLSISCSHQTVKYEYLDSKHETQEDRHERKVWRTIY